jgi:predicted ester cyclase
MSKAIFREHFEQIWNNKDASGIERFIAPNYRGFDAAEVISGIEGYKQHFVTITTGFPDLRITIEAILEEADRVAARWVVEATHTGHFGDIPPTGKRVRMTGIAIARIRNPPDCRGACEFGRARAVEADRRHPRVRQGRSPDLLRLSMECPQISSTDLDV